MGKRLSQIIKLFTLLISFIPLYSDALDLSQDRSTIESLSASPDQLKPPWQKRPEKDSSIVRKKIHPKIDLHKRLTEKMQVVEEMKSYLSAHPEMIEGLSHRDLKERIVKFVPGNRLKGHWYVNFIQQKDGIEVEGTEVRFTLKMIGPEKFRIVRLETVVAPELQQKGFRPAFSDQQILTKARQALEENDIVRSQDQLEIKKTTIRFALGSWRKMAEVTKGHFRAYVDVESGERWVGDDRIPFRGDVQGRVITEWETGYGGGAPGSLGDIHPDLVDLGDLQVTTNSEASAFTDPVSGQFSLFEGTPLSDIPSPLVLTLKLDGHWARVSEVTGSWPDPLIEMYEIDEELTAGDPRLDSSAPPVPFLFNPEGIDEYRIAQVNAYYHMNLIHNWLRERHIGQEIDLPVWAYINHTACPGCSAAYGSNLIDFYQTRGMSSALDLEIIYHEYTHFVDDKIGGIASGTNHSWTYIIPSFILNDRGVSGADNNYCLNQDDVGSLETTYIVGTAAGGFAWRLREGLIQSLGEEEGIRYAEELILPVLYDNPSTPNEIVFDVMVRDDDDGDLSNGTPHLQMITSAAEAHCLTTDIMDTTPPGAINDLTASPITTPTDDLKTHNAVHLTWTAPGDNGSEGIARDYLVYHLDDPDLLRDVFDDHASYQNRKFESLGHPIPTPVFGGTVQGYDYGCLIPNATNYIAIKSRDDVFLQSEISNIVEVTAPPDTTPATESSITGTPGDTVAFLNWTLLDEMKGAILRPEVYGWVEYGLTTAYGQRSLLRTPTLLPDFPGLPAPSNIYNDPRCYREIRMNVRLSGLNPQTTYHYQTHYRDEFGNETIGADRTLTTTAPSTAVCGNGRIEYPPEECDDGNGINEDSCTNGCASNRCGDGILNPSAELCDDGNLTSGDGCSYRCSNAVCGNGIRETGESCDDGNITTESCEYGQRRYCTVCNSRCYSGRGIRNYCGDGIINGPEVCDGNLNAGGYPCRSDCSGYDGSCGDNVRNGNEVCDGDTNSGGYSCSSTCAAYVGYCGDGIRNGPEGCDDRNRIDTDACTNACRPARCGDGIVGTYRLGSRRTITEEQCDDGNRVTEICPYGVRTCRVCNGGCVWQERNGTYCGDRRVQRSNGEACDDGDDDDTDGCTRRCETCIRSGRRPAIVRGVQQTCCPGLALRRGVCRL